MTRNHQHEGTAQSFALRLICLAIPLFLAGCGHNAPRQPDNSTGQASTNVTTYEVKGVLKEIRADGWKARIAHEEIPGYMEAMTMNFDVKDTNELRGLAPGDAIRFRMLVTDTDGWIDQVRRTGTNEGRLLVPSAIPATAAASLPAEELAPGAPLPECTLTNQLGQVIRLSDFKGKALAFTFIFTRCPFPTFCPRLNNNFGLVQRQLSTPNAGTNWHLLSISFDPEYDTPARLAKYADGYKFNPAHWSFATGATDDIRQLGRAFGLAFWREGQVFNHNVRTVVVDTRGRVQKIYPDNEWQPADLVNEMKQAMRAQP